MDPLLHQISERRIDHPLSLDTRPAGESIAFDDQREVAFPGGIVAAMTAMLLAIVDQLDPRR